MKGGEGKEGERKRERKEIGIEFRGRGVYVCVRG